MSELDSVNASGGGTGVSGLDNNIAPSKTLAKFDWRQRGKTTPVRDQGGTTICWSYATLAGVEHNLLKKDLVEHKNLLDLNEFNYAYHSKNRNEGADLLGNTDYDLRDTEDRFKQWSEGYNAKKSAYTLLQWNSLQDQKSYFHDYSHNFQFKTTDVIWLDKDNKDAIKEAIVKYGSVIFSYVDFDRQDDKYHHNPYGYLSTRRSRGGHVALIVGWDDDIQKEKFDERPTKDGAFLVKNSWGENWGDGGYFWLSYETLLKQAFSVNVEKGDKYDFNYYYDGLFGDSDVVIKNSNKAAVLFRAQKGGENQVEVLKAINVGLQNAKGKKLKVKVYKDLEYNFKTINSQSPKVFEKTYDIENDGFISFELKDGDKEIELTKNKGFAIEAEIEGTGGEIIFSYEPESANDFSYYYDDNTWKNSLVEYKAAARIKAWTKLKTKQRQGEGSHTSGQSKDIGTADVNFRKNTFRWGDPVGKPTVEYNRALLEENKDYTLTFSNNFDKEDKYYSDNAVLNGNGLITITGKGEYSGQVKVPYFYKVALRPNFNSLNENFDSQGVNSSNSSKWQLTADKTYLNYVGDFQNHYRRTIFSVEEAKRFINEDQGRKEATVELNSKELTVTEEPKAVQQTHEVQETQETIDIPSVAPITTEVPVAPVSVPEHSTNTNNTITSASVSYRSEGGNLVTGLTGGAGAAMGLFALMSLWLKKRFF